MIREKATIESAAPLPPPRRPLPPPPPKPVAANAKPLKRSLDSVIKAYIDVDADKRDAIVREVLQHTSVADVRRADRLWTSLARHGSSPYGTVPVPSSPSGYDTVPAAIRAGYGVLPQQSLPALAGYGEVPTASLGG